MFYLTKKFYNRSFTKIYILSKRLMHIHKLEIDTESINKLSKFFATQHPNSHILTQYALDNLSIISVLESQIKKEYKPYIKVANPTLAEEFFQGMREHSKSSLEDLIGVSLSSKELKIHTFLKDEFINEFVPYTFNSNFQKMLEKYGISFGINPKLYNYCSIIGTKLFVSIQKDNTINDFFCDPNFLSIIASNCLLGAFLYNVDATFLASYTELLNNMVKQLNLIKTCYEHVGMGVDLLQIDINVLPSSELLRKPFGSVMEIVNSLPSISETTPLIPDYLYVNRLVIKKIPFLGDLIFQIIDYCCRSHNHFLNISPFFTKTVDLAVKFSLEIAHFFHLLSNIQYTTPNIDSLPESSSGGSEGDDKNPSFNRKVKVICLFGLVIGVARLFGNN